jgi:hypothetical protein
MANWRMPTYAQRVELITEWVREFTGVRDKIQVRYMQVLDSWQVTVVEESEREYGSTAHSTRLRASEVLTDKQVFRVLREAGFPHSHNHLTTAEQLARADAAFADL